MLERIARAFGPRVAAIVDACSDTADLTEREAWIERKRRHLSHLPEIDDDAILRAALADKAVYATEHVSKVRELRLLIVAGLPGGEVKAKFDRYRASLAMLERELADAHIVELLRFEVEALEQLPPQPTAPEQAEAPTGANHTEAIPMREQRHAIMWTQGHQLGGAALKRGITDGTVSVHALLKAPSMPADRCTVAELLRSQAGWGPARTLRFLTRHGVGERKQLGQLTDRQRSIMAADLA